MAKKKLDKGYWHEATDRTLCVMDIIEAMLWKHPTVTQTPSLKKKIQKVQDILGEVYQEAGAKM